MSGAKLILNCKYFKSGSGSKSTLKNLVLYIGTRDGVQKITLKNVSKHLPPTPKQLDLVTRLEKGLGIGFGLPEFEDYVEHRTRVPPVHTSQH